MAHSVEERLQQFLGAPSPATDDRALRAECGRFVRNLRLSPREQGLLLVQVMQAYTGHCGWTGQGAKMWQLMEYLVRRSELQFERQAMLDCLALLPRFRGVLLSQPDLGRDDRYEHCEARLLACTHSSP
jgi:hypothetical protein